MSTQDEADEADGPDEAREENRDEPWMEVIHRAAPEVAEHVVRRLQSEGLQATAVDVPNFIVLLVTFGTYRVRIAVPRDQAEEARRVLAAWDEEAGPVVRDLARALRRQAIVALAASAFGGLLLLFLRGGEGVGLLLRDVPVIFLLVFLMISVRERLLSK